MRRYDKILSSLGTDGRRAVGGIPGVRAAHRYLYSRLQPHGETDVELNGFLMRLSHDDVVGRELIRTGTWEPFQTELFLSVIPDGARVADVGAHIGYYTLLASRAVGSTGHVDAFEPVPENYDKLVRHLRGNAVQNVSAVPKALASAPGQLDLYTEAGNSGKPSSSIDNVQLWPAEKLDISRRSVEATTLDAYYGDLGFPAVDVLKIDVQGAEGAVFGGGKKLLSSHPPRVCFMEFWPHGLRNLGTDPVELLGLLQQHGYTVRVIDETNRVVHDWPANEIVASCGAREAGMGHVDLMLTQADSLT